MGSTPFGRAILREVAQLGRALGLGPRGRRFESCLPDHFRGLSSAGRAPALHAGGQRFDPARLHQKKILTPVSDRVNIVKSLSGDNVVP